MSRLTPRLKLVPLTNLTSPDKKDLVQIYRDYWWVLDADQNTLWYHGRSPQCNPDEEICKGIRDRLYPGMSIQLVPVAFIPIRSNDYDFDV